MRRRHLFVLALAGSVLAACGSSKFDRSASGAGIGAATGAGIGAIFGGVGAVPGAVVGGAIGAGTGYATRQDDVNFGDPAWK